MEIKQASQVNELKEVGTLFREYFEWLKDVHDIEFSEENTEEELTTLPGRYALPSGRLLIAYDSGKAAGCGALLPLNQQICEMKRVYIRPAYRGKGLGRELAKKLIEEARVAGYSQIRIEINKFMYTAQTLYMTLGFYEVEPDKDQNTIIDDKSVCMELRLNEP